MTRHVVNTIAGEFDKARYDALCKALANAQMREAVNFTFQGQELLTEFAEYLVEFLEPHLKHIK